MNSSRATIGDQQSKHVSQITANFREGLSVIPTHVSRRYALKTADAGHLTRRPVDATQDVIVTELDREIFDGIERAAFPTVHRLFALAGRCAFV